MREVVAELLVTDIAAVKLGRRGITDVEVEQLLGNAHLTVRNPRGSGGAKRRVLIGRSDGGRALTLVIEPTIEPSSWLVITGWTATERERKVLGD